MINEAEALKLSQRLRRVRGQVEGIDRMIQEGRYCVDILQQIAAARAALHQVGLLILESHSRSCVVEGIRSGDEDRVITELMGVYKALNK